MSYLVVIWTDLRFDDGFADAEKQSTQLSHYVVISHQTPFVFLVKWVMTVKKPNNQPAS